MKLDIEINDTKRTIDIDESAGRFRLEIDGRTVEGDVLRPEPGLYTFFVGDRVVSARVSRIAGSESTRVEIGESAASIRVVDRKHRAVGSDAGGEGLQSVVAPMPGKVVAVLVAAGDQVERGQGVLVVEAMKMQNEVKAQKSGVVADVRVAAGEAVAAGQVLATIE